MSGKTVVAFAARDLLLQRSYRLALPFDLFWGLIDLVLYYFISRVVGSPAASLGHAPSYFDFALAGVLGSLVVASATSEIASRVREEELTGTLEAVCAQPVSSSDLAFGWASFPIAYAGARVALYLAVAVAFLHLHTGTTSWVGVAVVFAASSAAFLPLGVLAAAATVVFKRGGTVVGVAIFGMTFAGGALFPLGVLPGWLEAIGKTMPTRFAFDGLRGALFGGGWGTEAAALAGISAVGIPISVWLFDVALDRAKRQGSLAQY